MKKAAETTLFLSLFRLKILIVKNFGAPDPRRIVMTLNSDSLVTIRLGSLQKTGFLFLS
jgi:hypothetical protein